MILLPMLLAGVTVVGPRTAIPVQALHLDGVPKPAISLLSVATASAQRSSVTLGRKLPQRPPVTRAGRSGHVSAATRATAIFAGALIGAAGGIVVGGAMDAATSGGECLTFMTYGMPVGAAVGAGLTAHFLR